MMGAGKSSVGPLLARRLGRRYVDTDAEVERSVGRCVAEIRARRAGVPQAAVIGFAARAAVVALGGAMRARQRLASTGTVVYLRAP
jgi:shikimate kinase